MSYSIFFIHELIFLFLKMGGGQNLDRQNVEWPIFRNFKIANTKMMKDELFDSFIIEFIFFSFFINYLNIQND